MSRCACVGCAERRSDMEAAAEIGKALIETQRRVIAKLERRNGALLEATRLAHESLTDVYDGAPDGESPFAGAGYVLTVLKRAIEDAGGGAP